MFYIYFSRKEAGLNLTLYLFNTSLLMMKVNTKNTVSLFGKEIAKHVFNSEKI